VIVAAMVDAERDTIYAAIDAALPQSA